MKHLFSTPGESLKSSFLLLCGWRRCSRSFQLSRSMMTSVSMVVRLGSFTCVTIVAVLDASRPIALGTRRLSLVSWISSMMVIIVPLALLPLRPLPPLRLVCRLGTLPISAPCLSPYCLCSSCSLARCCSYFNASRNTDVPMRCDHEKLGASLERRLHAELIYPVTMLCPRVPVGGLWGCSRCNK